MSKEAQENDAIKNIKESIGNWYEEHPDVAYSLTGAGLGGLLYTLLMGKDTTGLGAMGSAGLGGGLGYLTSQGVQQHGEDIFRDEVSEINENMSYDKAKELIENPEKMKNFVVQTAKDKGWGEDKAKKLYESIPSYWGDEGIDTSAWERIKKSNPVPGLTNPLLTNYRSIPVAAGLAAPMSPRVRQAASQGTQSLLRKAKLRKTPPSRVTKAPIAGGALKAKGFATLGGTILLNLVTDHLLSERKGHKRSKLMDNYKGPEEIDFSSSFNNNNE